jgi:hypothetical protein
MILDMIKVKGMAKTEANIGEILSLIFNKTTKIYMAPEETEILTKYVSGNCKNFLSVGLVL